MRNIMLIACCRSGHNFIHEQLKSWDVNKQLLIYNCEDMLPANYEEEKYGIVADGLLLDTQFETIKIIVVRDLLNWWASYLKWGQRVPFILAPEKIRYAFTIWNAQVLEAFIPRFMCFPIPCEYDVFKTSRYYRGQLCRRIGGLRYNEKMLDFVPSTGDGSSFSGTSIKGTELETAYRYKQVLDTPLRDAYVRGLQSNMLSLEVYKRFFSLTDEQKEFISTL